MSQRLASLPTRRKMRILYNILSSNSHVKHGAEENVPGGCEAEVCMSHMDPVSGTDIDLFIEGMIPCSLHLADQAEMEREKKKLETNPAK